MQSGDSLSLSGFDVGGIGASTGGTAGRYISETEMDAHLEGNLATEASMLVLDTLELIVQVRLYSNCLILKQSYLVIV